MKVLIDTCIIIDALQNREPFCDDAHTIFIAVANNTINGYISAKSLTDIYYLTHKSTHSNEMTRDIIQKLLSLFSILDTTAMDCKKALMSDITDYEDAVMVETALRENVDFIVTRNIKDYKNSSVPILSSHKLVERISDNQ